MVSGVTKLYEIEIYNVKYAIYSESYQLVDPIGIDIFPIGYSLFPTGYALSAGPGPIGIPYWYSL